MTIESRDDGISLTMRRNEAEALAGVAQTRLAVSDALHLITNTATAERALTQLRASRGSLSLRRPEAAALAAIAEQPPRWKAHSAAGSLLFAAVDLAAARRGLDQLRGALR